MTSIPDAPKTYTIGRLLRDLAWVALILLTLELLLRLPPLSQRVEEVLANYEGLLRYDRYLPAYEREMEVNTDNLHNMWLLGSSYMMTSLNPERIQVYLDPPVSESISVQNYGLTELRDLEVMARTLGADLLLMDQPRYAVIGVGARNFVDQAAADTPILQSPYERAMILPSTIDDHIAGFLYRNSYLYRYTILLRSYFSAGGERFGPPSLWLGGYTERTGQISCDVEPDLSQERAPENFDFNAGAQRLDSFINTLESRGIHVMVLSIPLPACTIYDAEEFGSYENYMRHYLQPLTQHLQERAVPFYELDTRLFEEVPVAEHGLYYTDRTHTNIQGAALFSVWAAEYISDWLNALQ